GSEFTILALNFAEPEELVREFAQELGLSFPIFLDDNGVIQELYQVRGYPSSVFIDPDGIIRIIHIGIMTDGQLDGYLAEMGIGVE
ncbi:MAG: TlpA family protein disulfide reductase, partial [Anaerolineae bacterium]|nr:TlpA family protein disulfide reductase [Anaerolineae bacterium]